MIHQQPSDHSPFPLWIELSGLPGKLYEESKGAAPYLLLRVLVGLDMLRNPTKPSIIEVAPAELAARTGLPIEKLEKAIKQLRKAALLRAFLPDTQEENALFEILTPLTTPLSAEAVRDQNPQLPLGEWPPRYSVGATDACRSVKEENGQRVIDLYLNTFSMKLNSMVVDQLKMISDRYEFEIIQRSFAKARAQEKQSLSFLLSEIHREDRFRRQAKQTEFQSGSEPQKRKIPL